MMFDQGVFVLMLSKRVARRSEDRALGMLSGQENQQESPRIAVRINQHSA